MSRIGIDTSVLVGLLDAADIWHGQSVELVSAIRSHGHEIVVFDCVIAETVNTLGRRLFERKRLHDYEAILAALEDGYPPDQITWIFEDVRGLYPGIMSLVKGAQNKLNFNDALLALSCQSRQILFIASFDSDFDTLAWLKRISIANDVTALAKD